MSDENQTAEQVQALINKAVTLVQDAIAIIKESGETFRHYEKNHRDKVRPLVKDITTLKECLKVYEERGYADAARQAKDSIKEANRKLHETLDKAGLNEKMAEKCEQWLKEHVQ
jgi:hypothetical protein